MPSTKTRISVCVCVRVCKCVLIIRCEAARALNFPAVPSKDLLPLYITHTLHALLFYHYVLAASQKHSEKEHTHIHAHIKTEHAKCCMYKKSFWARTHTETQSPLYFVMAWFVHTNNIDNLLIMRRGKPYIEGSRTSEKCEFLVNKWLLNYHSCLSIHLIFTHIQMSEKSVQRA